MAEELKRPRFILLKEKPGVLAPVAMYVLIDNDGYIYMSESFIGLVFKCMMNWRSDSALVG